MNLVPPLLVATLPGRSVESIRSDALEAARGGADVGEVRMDRLSAGELAKLSQLFPAPIPLMATLRSTMEGGEGPSLPTARGPILVNAAQLPFRFLDLERARDRDLIANPPQGPDGGPVLFVSSHLDPSAPTAAVRDLLELPRPPNAVVKVVLPCGFDRLWSDLLPGLSPLDPFRPYVLHTTGPTGPILRAGAHRLGMFAVFATLPDAPAAHQKAAVEPSQIPVNQLRAFYAGPRTGPLFAVVGHPIQHSKSPMLHSRWMETEHRTGLYVALDMATAAELADSLAPLSEFGFRGLNVTHPWKQIALGLASRVAPAAEAAGCSNLLSLTPTGVEADNTDVAAVRRRATELRESGEWDGSPVVVLGGGGAARSALEAARSLGSRGIVVTRRRDVAEELANAYGGLVGRESELAPVRLVFHATPAGREGQPTLDLPWTAVIGAATHVVDFVYEPVHPFLRDRCREVGATYEDGSRLLVYQAAESYATWWGTLPSPDLQERALREVLCAA